MARSCFSAAHARVPEDIHTHDVVPTSFDWRRAFAASPISGGVTKPCPCRGSSRQIPPRISDCTHDGCEIVPLRKFFTPDCVSCFDRSSDDCEAMYKQWASCPSSSGLNGAWHVSDTICQFLVLASLRISLQCQVLDFTGGGGQLRWNRQPGMFPLNPFSSSVASFKPIT